MSPGPAFRSKVNVKAGIKIRILETERLTAKSVSGSWVKYSEPSDLFRAGLGGRCVTMVNKINLFHNDPPP